MQEIAAPLIEGSAAASPPILRIWIWPFLINISRIPNQEMKSIQNHTTFLPIWIWPFLINTTMNVSLDLHWNQQIKSKSKRHEEKRRARAHSAITKTNKEIRLKQQRTSDLIRVKHNACKLFVAVENQRFLVPVGTTNSNRSKTDWRTWRRTLEDGEKRHGVVHSWRTKNSSASISDAEQSKVSLASCNSSAIYLLEQVH